VAESGTITDSPFLQKPEGVGSVSFTNALSAGGGMSSGGDYRGGPPRKGFGRGGVKGRKRSKVRIKTKKKDPIFVDGVRPRPMYVDYKDIELLKKLVNRHGKIVSRRKSGCTAVSQHAVTLAIKRARFMALLPYVGE
jgi:small subunit ribosomal protein S18